MSTPTPLLDPRLTTVEHRLAALELGLVEHRGRLDAIADIVAPHPDDVALAAQRNLGDAVIAVRNATDVLNNSIRRLIEASAP